MWTATAALKLKDTLAPWKESYDKHSVLKSRDINLACKGPYNQSHGFSSSHVQRRLSTERLMLSNCGVGGVLRIPWTAKRSNQSPLKEINPEYSLEGLMLKLKLQYLGHLMQRADSLEKTLMLGKTEGRRRRGDRGWDGWMALLTQWTWVWANSRRQWRPGKPGVLQFMGWQRGTLWGCSQHELE